MIIFNTVVALCTVWKSSSWIFLNEWPICQPKQGYPPPSSYLLIINNNNKFRMHVIWYSFDSSIYHNWSDFISFSFILHKPNMIYWFYFFVLLRSIVSANWYSNSFFLFLVIRYRIIFQKNFFIYLFSAFSDLFCFVQINFDFDCSSLNTHSNTQKSTNQQLSTVFLWPKHNNIPWFVTSNSFWILITFQINNNHNKIVG